MYDKLQTYSKRLPDEVLETWQPPQAFRALLEFEPDADQDFTLSICPETELGVPTGEWTHLGIHHTFKLSWLRKTYNKLGNFLHVPTLKAQRGASRQQNLAQLRKTLEEIIAELEPIVASSIDSSLAAVVQFQCSVCNHMVVRNLDSVRKARQAVCLNPNCGAVFAAVEDEQGNLYFPLMDSPFLCLRCKHENRIENRKLAIGYRFTCEQCGEEHEFRMRQWGYCQVKALSEEDT